jgi:hypothetical protein
MPSCKTHNWSDQKGECPTCFPIWGMQKNVPFTRCPDCEALFPPEPHSVMIEKLRAKLAKARAALVYVAEWERFPDGLREQNYRMAKEALKEIDE